jgi:hypothetical protein
MTNANKPDPNNADAFDDQSLAITDAGLYQSEFWSISRHELIAAVAEEHVNNQTRNQLRRVVKPLTDRGLPDTLSDLAGWADRVKNRGPRRVMIRTRCHFLTTRETKPAAPGISSTCPSMLTNTVSTNTQP